MKNDDEHRDSPVEGTSKSARKRSRKRESVEQMNHPQILKNPNRPQYEPIDMGKIRNENQQKKAHYQQQSNGKNKTPNGNYRPQTQNGRNSNISAMTINPKTPRGTIKPLIPEPQSLMGMQLEGNQSAASPDNSRHFQSARSSTSNQISERQRAANHMQRSQYYKSENPGHLPTTKIIDACYQYTKEDFPLDKNTSILIDGKMDLMITACSVRCHAQYIRVKSQNQDDTFSVSSLLSSDANEKQIHEACMECMELFSNSAYRKNERIQFSKTSEAYLTKCLIKPLTEPSEAFPEALYYCTRCDFHINSVAHAKMHLEQSSHFDDVERQEQREKLLNDTPKPSNPHYEAATMYLETLVNDEIKKRKLNRTIIDEILLFLQKELFESLSYYNVQLKPFGSSTYDVFLADSDLNISFFIESVNNSQLFDFYARVCEQLNKVNENFDADLVSDGSNPAAVRFTYKTITVRLCSASNTNCRAQLSFSRLMQTYVKFNPDIARFLLLVRTWAVRVGIDSKNKQRVGLPRYGFDIISIHYLQFAGHLPVLHELVQRINEDVNNQESDVIEEARERRIRVYSNYLSNVDKIKELFRSKKEWKLAKIWIGFLKYLIVKHRDVVIQITQKEPMTKEMTRWNRKSYHVVDPFRADNVLTIPKFSSWLSFFFNCILSTFKVFAIPRNDQGSIVAVDFYQNKVSSPKKNNKKKGSHSETPNHKIIIVPSRDSPAFSTPKDSPTVSTPKEDTPIVASVNFVEMIPEEIDDTKSEKELTEIYNAAADELAEEEDVAEKSRKLVDRLRFDGVPIKRLTSDHTEIDEHRNSIYSRRTMMRVRRVGGRAEEPQILLAIPSSIMKNKRRKKSAKKLIAAVGTAADSAEATPPPKSDEIREEESEVFDGFEPLVKEPSTSTPSETPAVKFVERSATPPVENSWSHWNSYNNFSSTSPSAWRSAFSTTPQPSPPQLSAAVPAVVQSPAAKVQEENEAEDEEVAKLTENMNSVRMELRPSTSSTSSSIRKAEFGEFIGPSTFNQINSEVRAVDDHICYEEFFIRHEFDSKTIETLRQSMTTQDYRFSFEAQTLTDGYEMEVKCSSCDGNHIVDQCPTMEIPPIEKFAKRPISEIKELDDMIDKYYEDNSISQERLQLLENQVKVLEQQLRKDYRSDVVLTIFGSCMTGIGVNKSDIDVCLRFGDGFEQPENLAPVDVISQVAEKLRKSRITKKVQPILTAKVPIVKFQLKLDYDLYVDADISYYNILALYNTKLLRCYTLWSADNRFAKLGLFIKNWAKQCDIGDASKGSISSYAHIVLLISYLQACDPQVLPRLQEDFRDNNTEKRIVDNWDTYFYEGKPVPYPNNKLSCADLLLGFFDYYSRFDFRHFVIQCRREEKLSKLEKQWSKPLCIEDPFDLHHNLGAGVTRKMFAFIHRTFICSRKVFMTSNIREKIPKDSHFTDNYRKELLRNCSQGHAPSDRQCHTCSKIGHFAESCPKRLAQREAKRHRVSSQSTIGSFQSGGRHYANGSTPRRNDEDQYHKKPFHHRR